MANERDRGITQERFVTTVAHAARVGRDRAQRVADRAATDEDAARRVIDAVLETLSVRIAGGEVDDLRARLPVAFHPALERGKELSEEFLDVTSQPPAEYEALVRR
jgi:uncharacterized protein (DUF2267 family)